MSVVKLLKIRVGIHHDPYFYHLKAAIPSSLELFLWTEL